MIVIFTAILGTFLLALAIIDARSFRLPNILTLPLIALGLIQAYILGYIFGYGETLWASVRPNAIGAAAGYIAFVTLETGYRAMRGKDGLGRGDAKLLAAGGAWCTWTGLPFIILIASATGLIALLFPSIAKKARTHNALPFGPFLAFGIFCVWAAQRLSAYPL